MFQKAKLYFYTLNKIKPKQLFFITRQRMRLPVKSPLFIVDFKKDVILKELYFPDLDFERNFLRNFKEEELMQFKLSFFNVSQSVLLNQPWQYKKHTRLWSFHLHYFEWIFLLGSRFSETKDIKYYNNFKAWVLSWIRNHTNKKGDGWCPYPLSIRIVNWISAIGIFKKAIENDKIFLNQITTSINVQLGFLSVHLEKHLLGNHYLENLKALLIGSIYFNSPEKIRYYMNLYVIELEKQLFPDGFLEDRSFQYHHIILEGVLKLYLYALKYRLPHLDALEKNLIQMTVVIKSMEEGLSRIPFFNDCTVNMSKSAQSLYMTAEKLLNKKVVKKNFLPHVGFYKLAHGDITLLCDCGDISPPYNPGHAHAEIGSFELYYKGFPIIVNSGTMTYSNNEKRVFYRGTKAHNTVIIDQEEQSECWAAFRVARRAKLIGVATKPNRIFCGVKTFSGKSFDRSFHLLSQNKLIISDEIVKGMQVATSFWHFHPQVVIRKAQNGYHLLLKDQLIAQLTFFGQDHSWVEEGFYSEKIGLEEKIQVLVLEQQKFEKPFGVQIQWMN